MNINQNISKLLYALKIKGNIYKINTFKFYSEMKDKYTTKYQVMKKEPYERLNPETEEIEIKYRYVTEKECYSKVDVMKYLAEEHRKGSEANG